jgi:thiamine pyrophosphate-dependent acetolactate synthase large subunit-like protein
VNHPESGGGERVESVRHPVQERAARPRRAARHAPARADLAELARAFGAHGERVEKPAELIPAYRRALASQKPALVDVVIGNDWDELEAPTKLRVSDRY